MTYLFSNNETTSIKPDFVLDMDEAKENFVLAHVKPEIRQTIISIKEVADCLNFEKITSALLKSCPQDAVVHLTQPSLDAITQIAHKNLPHRLSPKYRPGKF